MAPDGLRGPPSIEAGLAHHRAGRLAEAEAVYRAILAVEPENQAAWLNLGAALHGAGKEGAREALEHLTRIAPGNADAWCNLGVVQRAAGSASEAEASWRRALDLAPLHPDACFNLGRLLSGSRREAEALPLLERGVILRPQDGQRWSALATAKIHLGDVWGGLDDLERALRMASQDAELWSNHGSALQSVGRFEESMASFDRARALAPANADIRYNRALTLLLLKRPGAWEEHEHRWEAPGFTSPVRRFRAPLWDGSSMPDGTLLLHAEQGLGDTIQFVRYVAAAHARAGGRTVLEVQPPLVSLMARSLQGVEVIAQGDPHPPFDAHAPLLSLPAILGEEAGPSAPYLVPADPSSMAARLGTRRAPRVGLAWAGNPAHGNDRNRSIPFGRLAPLLAVTGIEFVSLQKGERTGDPRGHGASVLDAGAWLDDLDAAASLLACLDLLVSVDTALAHLAGAIGCKVLLLLPFRPDWRWGVEGETVRWYGSVRVLRQARPGDWSRPIQNAETSLHALARAPALV